MVVCTNFEEFFQGHQRSCYFQWIMNDFITSEGFLDTFAYLDNVTIYGKNQTHHDYNPCHKLYYVIQKDQLNY